jgi:hypothetical protein
MNGLQCVEGLCHLHLQGQWKEHSAFETLGAAHALIEGHMLEGKLSAVLLEPQVLHFVMTVSSWAGPALVLNGSSSCCCWDSSSSTTSAEQISSHNKSAASGQHPDTQQLDSTRKSALLSTDLPPVGPGVVLGNQLISLHSPQLLVQSAEVELIGHCLFIAEMLVWKV